MNNQLIDEQSVREEAQVLRERLKTEMGRDDDLTTGLEAREWARQNVIMRTLLQQAAGDGSPEELMAKVVSTVSRPKPAEIAAYFKRFSFNYQLPEVVHAAHIVKNVDEATTESQAEAAILEVERQLKAGADFAALADAHSDCPGNGGDLGGFPRGDMVPEFDQVVFALQPGEVSRIFRTPFGFHIAKLFECLPSRPASLNEARPEIEQELWNAKKTQAISDFMEALRAKADIRKV